jgi:hypothetical protein
MLKPGDPITAKMLLLPHPVLKHAVPVALMSQILSLILSTTRLRQRGLANGLLLMTREILGHPIIVEMVRRLGLDVAVLALLTDIDLVHSIACVQLVLCISELACSKDFGIARSFKKNKKSLK